MATNKQRITTHCTGTRFVPSFDDPAAGQTTIRSQNNNIGIFDVCTAKTGQLADLLDPAGDDGSNNT